MNITLLEPPETDAEGNTRSFSIASAPFETDLTVVTGMRDTAFSHAFEVFDLVFITLQTVHIVAIISIISLARRYQGMTCGFHRLLATAGAVDERKAS